MTRKKNPQKNLPLPTGKESKQQLFRAATVEAHLEAHSGPLPDPSSLQKYNDVLPGAAERIIHMAEQQQGHRQR